MIANGRTSLQQGGPLPRVYVLRQDWVVLNCEWFAAAYVSRHLPFETTYSHSALAYFPSLLWLCTLL